MANSSSKYRIYYFCIGYVGVFSLLAALGYFMSGKPDAEGTHAAITHEFATDLAFYDLPRMMVQFNSGGASKHVRLDISIEVAKKDLPIVQGYQPRMTANLNTLFLDIDPDRMQKASSLPWLHKEMLRQINSVGSPAPVHDVFLRQMLIM